MNEIVWALAPFLFVASILALIPACVFAGMLLERRRHKSVPDRFVPAPVTPRPVVFLEERLLVAEATIGVLEGAEGRAASEATYWRGVVEQMTVELVRMSALKSRHWRSLKRLRARDRITQALTNMVAPMIGETV